MSASKNDAAVAGQGGPFKSHVPESKPLQEGGHKPGVLASEKDRAPEFHAQAVPAGTAPKEATYTPNPDLNNQRMYQSASSTLGGATSADVHKGYGHPGQGQTSKEIRHDRPIKGEGLGYVGLKDQVLEHGTVDSRQPEFADQRRLDSDVPAGQRGKIEKPGAEDVPDNKVLLPARDQ